MPAAKPKAEPKAEPGQRLRPSALAEPDLIERARWDAEAFSELYLRQVDSIRAYVYRRTGDLNVTDDLVSETFLNALRTIHRFRQRGVPLRCWLLRIATNAVHHWLRGQGRQGVPLGGTDRAAKERSEVDPDELEQAQQALLRLSPQHQALLSLHYLEGLELTEIAPILGCRVGTVKSGLSRAREALKQELDPSPHPEAIR